MKQENSSHQPLDTCRLLCKDLFNTENQMGYVILIFISQWGKLFPHGLVSFWPCLISFGLCVLWGNVNSHLGMTVPKGGCQWKRVSWERKGAAENFWISVVVLHLAYALPDTVTRWSDDVIMGYLHLPWGLLEPFSPSVQTPDWSPGLKDHVGERHFLVLFFFFFGAIKRRILWFKPGLNDNTFPCTTKTGVANSILFHTWTEGCVAGVRKEEGDQKAGQRDGCESWNSDFQVLGVSCPAFWSSFLHGRARWQFSGAQS